MAPPPARRPKTNSRLVIHRDERCGRSAIAFSRALTCSAACVSLSPRASRRGRPESGFRLRSAGSCRHDCGGRRRCCKPYAVVRNVCSSTSQLPGTSGSRLRYEVRRKATTRAPN
ncbi:hypothetical protein MRX96_056129 [Rhipicephalus microplus]